MTPEQKPVTCWSDYFTHLVFTNLEFLSPNLLLIDFCLRIKIYTICQNMSKYYLLLFILIEWKKNHQINKTITNKEFKTLENKINDETI